MDSYVVPLSIALPFVLVLLIFIVKVIYSSKCQKIYCCCGLCAIVRDVSHEQDINSIRVPHIGSFTNIFSQQKEQPKEEITL